MRQAHTVADIRAAEEALMAGLPAGALMQRAAHGLAHAVLDFLGGAYGRRVRLLVGAGNNGGDALYAGAVLARRGARVDAVLLAPDRVHREGLAALRAAGGWVAADPPVADRLDVAIDGIVGIGGSGPLRPAAVAALEACGEAPVIAVDVPSGVDVDTGELPGPHVRAALTVTFGAFKVAQLVDPAARACGVVHLVDIGLELAGPPAVTALQPADVAALLPRPPADAHKYSRGVVGVRTGSAGYPGAAVLSVAGAGCGLAGMVRYDGDATDAVRAAHPEVVVGGGRVQAWVVGSGSGDLAASALAASLADWVPVVADADALVGLDRLLGPGETEADARSRSRLVLTPHAGELARLLDVARTEVEARPLHHARVAAARYGAVVLLKGRRTLVAGPSGPVHATTTGTPWLATAGAGDVLAGLIGALLAAGLAPYDAAAAGSWLHGAAATIASRGGPVTAGVVAAAIPAAVRALGTAT